MPPSATQPDADAPRPPLVVGHWPHLRTRDSTPVIMWSVAASLVPALVAAGWFFGVRAWMHVALAVGTAVATEALVQRFVRRTRVTVADGSAVVTGVLVAFCLPAQARWFVPVVASFVAIGIAKHCFGGLGCNIWNPALVGRAFVHLSFASDMNLARNYRLLENRHFWGDLGTALQPTAPAGVDAVSSASPLGLLKGVAADWVTARDQVADLLREDLPSLWEMFVGNIRGNIGETSALLLLVGAVYLIARGWVRWQIPVAYLAVVALGALLLPLRITPADGEVGWHPIVAAAPALAPRYVAYHLLGGGLVLGALYMATDMVTSPLTNRGMLIFGAGCGVLTILIRLYGGYPEAVCYSILLMNTAVPLIDRFTQNRIFGHAR